MKTATTKTVVQILAALGVVLASSLTGCASTTPTITPDVVTQEVAPAPVTQEAIQRQAFDNLITLKYGAALVAPAAEVSKSFCEMLDTGNSFDTVVNVSLDIAAQQGVSAADLGYIIGVGIPAFCPSHTADQKAWMATH